jgi:HEAT repeat protein
MIPKDAARLWEELRHREPEEKLEWIRELARNPTPDSIEVLLDVLKQESWFLRDQAARALATLGESVVEPLIEYLNSGLWYTRTAAASALGRMALPVSAAPLVALLKDPNRTVRDAARDALVLVCGNEMGRFEVAVAFHGLPERARRFALDALGVRNPEIADRVAGLMHDPALPGQADRRHLARAVNEDGLRWEDVVGDEGAEQGSG